MSLYRPPFTLKPFQVDFIARAISQPSLCIGADCGMGKGHMALCIACLLLEDRQIDNVVWECEKAKLGEWEDDLANFTDLDVGLLTGGPENRAQTIARVPQVMLGTYEAIRSEAAYTEQVQRGNRTVTTMLSGPLTRALEGRKVLFVWDEASAKLGADRGSGIYRNHEYLLKTLRKQNEVRVIPTTATFMDRDPFGWFNLTRLLDPAHCGTVKEFETSHVDYNQFGKVSQFKFISPDECPPGIRSFREKTQHLIAYKSKQDTDVAWMFPKVVPQSDYVVLGERHQGFYEEVAKSFDEENYQEQKALFGVMRQIAGHPMSLKMSVDKARAEKKNPPMVAAAVVDQIGESGLRALGSAKLDHLVNVLRSEVGSEPAVIFTFYGQSILPLLKDRLTDEGYEIVTNHGGLTHPQRRKAQAAFRSGSKQIFLSSDAGCRGINLPEARWVINYEMPLTYSVWWQRINRANRLDSKLDKTLVKDLIVKNTVEDGIVGLGLKRHGWFDALLPDTEDGSNYLTPETRKLLLKISRNNAI